MPRSSRAYVIFVVSKDYSETTSRKRKDMRLYPQSILTFLCMALTADAYLVADLTCKTFLSKLVLFTCLLIPIGALSKLIFHLWKTGLLHGMPMIPPDWRDSRYPVSTNTSGWPVRYMETMLPRPTQNTN